MTTRPNHRCPECSALFAEVGVVHRRSLLTLLRHRVDGRRRFVKVFAVRRSTDTDMTPVYVRVEGR